jgi:hypothetical protein
MKTKMFAALAVAVAVAAGGAAWAFTESSQPVLPNEPTQQPTAVAAVGCCVTGDCCCPGQGSCCDPALRVTGEAAKSLNRAVSCCSTGACCCPGSGSCCAPAVAVTSGDEKPACCKTRE